MGLILGLAAPVSAQVVYETVSQNDGNVTNGHLATAQTFTVPTTASVLANYTFTVAARPADGNLTFSILPWNTSGPVGTAVFTTTLLWPAAGGNLGISGQTISLASGQLYGALIDFQGYAGASVHYTSIATFNLGNGWWGSPGGLSNFPNLDHVFRAEFVAVPEPSTWGLLVLGIMTAGVLFRGRVRRAR